MKCKTLFFYIINLSIFLSSLYSQTIVLEAEEGLLNGVTIATSRQGYSGSGYVTGFDNSSDYVEVSFQIQTSGIYELQIRYAAPYGYKENYLYVNDQLQATVPFPASAEFTTTSAGKIFLSSGINKIKIQSYWGWFEVDSFIVIFSSSDFSLDKISKILVTPNPIPEAQKLYNFLLNNYGKKIISGQWSDHTASYTELNYINEVSSKQPAIWGLDMLYYSGSAPTSWRNDVPQKAIDWWKNKKGIVTMCWHWFSPKDWTDQIWNSFYSDKTNFDVRLAVQQGTEEYNLIIRDIDIIANEFKTLQQQGVPILWRPLHEASGGWFWWGKYGPEPCKQLYRIMFDRMVNYHGLKNLIWVWTVTKTTDDELDWYPGDDVVDIIGIDIYAPNGDYSAHTLTFYKISEMFGNKKIVALTENGPIPDPDLLVQQQAYWSWFCTWGGEFILDGQKNSQSHINKVYNHDYVITLDELPDLLSYPISDGDTIYYHLTITISPPDAGSVDLIPSGGIYTAGTQVQLTAQANSGYVFSSWSGDLSGTQNPATITMDSNKVVTANFTLSGGGGGTAYTLSVNVSPTGSGVVYLDPSGGVYTAGTQVTLTAVANSGYVFSSWSGDLSGTQNPATITMDSNKLVTANFTQQQQYSLNIVINPQGSGVVSINPFKGSYTAGEQVQLTAMANNGYVFSSWSGDLSGTQNPTTITMDTNKTIMANFVQSGNGNGSTMYTLSVGVSPESAGRVYLNPSGGVYTAGTQVELIAEANIGYIFSDWSGSLVSTQNPVTITMDENKVITANFSQNFINYTLTVNINPEGSGIVRMEPSGGVYTAGTQVTLTAEGYGLYEFSFWSGDLTGSQNPVTITMDNNKIITANFVYYPPSTISVSIDKNPFYISKDKEVVFTYSISENNNNNVIMELNLRIYDIKMNLVREIKKYNLSSTGTITWDGKDNFGFLVGPGIYLYKISTDKQNSNKLGKMLVLQ